MFILVADYNVIRKDPQPTFSPHRAEVRGNGEIANGFDLAAMNPPLPGSAPRAGESTRLRREIGPVGVGVDVLVIDDAGFDKWSEASGSTLYWAKREGRVLYPIG